MLTGWAKKARQKKGLIFLQTEDEPAAGFGVLGAALGGKRAWTATAGVGHVLMQDPLMLAEAMRIPFVAYIGQRGGPSTGTVIYSQQELNLARQGGNGEGMRIVLGPSSLQELYDYMIRGFEIAWKYRIPVIILGDGYLSKMTGAVNLTKPKLSAKKKAIVSQDSIVNLRNSFSLEEELGDILAEEMKEFAEISKKVEDSEAFGCSDAKVVIFSWGTTALAAKEAVKEFQSENKKVGYFRPITLRPFSAKAAKDAVKNCSKILICESACGQFGRLVTEALFGVEGVEVTRFYKPAEGITKEEIVKKAKEML